jgi:polar amino acid transport system substrate-binding protein
MDATGGAPYVFDNNTKGFEVELAEFLAAELGCTSEPVNGEWNKLPELLVRGDIDVVLNGYEYADVFRAQASRPYFIYRLTLVTNAAANLRGWDELRGRDGKAGRRVGVLTGSAAHRYLEKAFGDSIQLQVYEDVANTYDLVANGQLDATVQDTPAAAYYVKADQQGRLRALEETRAEGFYVILTRPQDTELRSRIDDALRKGIRNGTLERIYRKYGIWTSDQERLGFWADKTWGDELPVAQQESALTPINWEYSLRLLGRAALTTVLLAVCAMPLATLIGLIVAAGRLYGPRWLDWLLTVYVEVLRGTPLLLQLWVLFYLLPRLVPALGQVHPIEIGILGLALNYSASEAEHFRGAFLNLARGQMEAALSLGMSRWKAIRVILVPQAVRAAVPSVTNDFVALFKDTAVCSVIAVMELTKQYNTLYNNHRDHILTLAAITAGLYLLMSYPLALVARRLERRLGKEER